MANEDHCIERDETGNYENIIGSECCIASPSCEKAQSNCDAIDDTKHNTGTNDMFTHWIVHHSDVCLMWRGWKTAVWEQRSGNLWLSVFQVRRYSKNTLHVPLVARVVTTVFAVS